MKQASYPLSDFPGIPYEYAEVLKSKGIHDSRELRERTLVASQREELSSLCGIPPRRMLELHELCELVSLRGIDPPLAYRLHLQDVSDVDRLSALSAAQLHRSFPERTEEEWVLSLSQARKYRQKKY